MSDEDPRVLAWLERASAMGFDDYNPVAVIQAVNGLQLLGKDAALDAIESHPIGSGHYGLFWALRALFDLPASRGFPPVRLGVPTISPPTSPETLPRFPIVIVRDIPLLVVRGYSLGGLPEPVLDHVVYYRVHGTIRGQPLKPPSTANGIVAEFLERWTKAYGDRYTAAAVATINDQLAKVFKA